MAYDINRVQRVILQPSAIKQWQKSALRSSCLLGLLRKRASNVMEKNQSVEGACVVPIMQDDHLTTSY